MQFADLRLSVAAIRGHTGGFESDLMDSPAPQVGWFKVIRR